MKSARRAGRGSSAARTEPSSPRRPSRVSRARGCGRRSRSRPSSPRASARRRRESLREKFCDDARRRTGAALQDEVRSVRDLGSAGRDGTELALIASPSARRHEPIHGTPTGEAMGARTRARSRQACRPRPSRRDDARALAARRPSSRPARHFRRPPPRPRARRTSAARPSAAPAARTPPARAAASTPPARAAAARRSRPARAPPRARALARRGESRAGRRTTPPRAHIAPPAARPGRRARRSRVARRADTRPRGHRPPAGARRAAARRGDRCRPCRAGGEPGAAAFDREWLPGRRKRRRTTRSSRGQRPDAICESSTARLAAPPEALH